MNTIDLTTSLLPMIWALDGLLAVSAAAIVGDILFTHLRRRRRVKLLRPTATVSPAALSTSVAQ